MVSPSSALPDCAFQGSGHSCSVRRLLPSMSPRSPSGELLGAQAEPSLCDGLCWEQEGADSANGSLSSCISVINGLSHRHLIDVINMIFTTEYGKRCIVLLLYVHQGAWMSLWWPCLPPLAFSLLCYPHNHCPDHWPTLGLGR